MPNELYILDWNDNLTGIFEAKLTFYMPVHSYIVFVGAVDIILPEIYRDWMFSLRSKTFVNL